MLLSILDSPFFTLDVIIELDGPCLTLVALALGIVHLTTIQFIFLSIRTSLIIVYDAVWPVASSTLPGFVSFSVFLSSHLLQYLSRNPLICYKYSPVWPC